MSEKHLQSAQKNDTLTTDQLRAELERIERQLIPLLVTIQRLLGKEPSVLTRDCKRRRQ